MKESIEEKCPSNDELNSYYDALYTGDACEERHEWIRIHIQKCEACRKTIEAFETIDRLMSKAFEAEAGVAERVKAECRVAERRRRWKTLMRIAAAAVVLIGISGWIWSSSQLESSSGMIAQGPSETMIVAEKPSERHPDVEPSTAVASAATAKDTPLELNEIWADATAEPKSAPSHGVGISGKDIRQVGIDGKGPMVLSTKSNSRELNDSVRHIWLVDDLTASHDLLNSFTQRTGIKATFADTTEGRLIVRLQGMTDRQLQGLVEQLNERQWALASPMLPQPKQQERVKFTGKPVSYTLWRVEKGKKP